jgi:ubiquinone/menaquinone biosynthesis C-methylase UbiE
MLQRDQQPGLMDDPKLAKPDRERALAGLARLNRVSGVAGAMYHHLRRYARVHALENRPLSVLDVASGAGDIPLAWGRRAKREGLNMQLTLLDSNSVVVEAQQQRARRMDVEVLSLQHDCLKTPLPAGFDVVTCSLFLHQLDEHQAFRLLQEMQSATENAMVICDLERSRTNLVVVQIASRLLTRSKIVHHDAANIVRSAYTMNEFEDLAQNALARPIRVRRVFPCRMLAICDEQTVSQPVPAFA